MTRARTKLWIGRVAAAGLLVVACAADARSQPNTGRWAQHYHARVAQFKEDNAAGKNIVLVGSSHIEGFDTDRYLPGHRIVNRGIAADRIGIGDRGILRRLDSSVFDCNPGLIIIENGVNDLGELWRHGTPPIDEIEQCYRQVVQTIRARLPKVPLVIVGLFPTRAKYAPLVPNIVEFNRRLATIAADFGCEFMDVYGPFADDEGLLRTEYSREGLHLTEAGYRRWAEMLQQVLPPRQAESPPDVGHPHGASTRRAP